ALGETVVDADVLPLDPAVFLQSLTKCLKQTPHCRRARDSRQEKANAANCRSCLLRPRRERPCGRAADERDEVAAFHFLMPPVLPTERIAHPNRAGDLLRRGISVSSMSGLGQSRLSRAEPHHRHVRFAPKADEAPTCWHVRLVPILLQKSPRREARCALAP